MGFLSSGNTLEWQEAKKYAEFIRSEGIKQFLHIYKAVKDRRNDHLQWGDETEYILVKIDKEKKKVKLSLRAGEIFDVLRKRELDGSDTRALWRPEYGAFMLEATPFAPYGGSMKEFLCVEASMRLRREMAEELLHDDEELLSITSYPMLGVGDYCDFSEDKRGHIANSLYISDKIINPHLRFGTLTRNIRLRRQENVSILVPVFKDKFTKAPQEHHEGGADEDHIHMDAMAFGMGCCCLQTTFQCCSIDEARILYDQLAMLCPIMMALSASAPLYRGYLSAQDARWNVIAASVDCRSPEERGQQPLNNEKWRIPKSRYDNISLYISNQPEMKEEEFNDTNPPINDKVYEFLLENDVDTRLARHLAHLFIRDPLVIYDNEIQLDEQSRSDHFENIQSTNWQTVRFKPPPPKSPIGWRVEFRRLLQRLLTISIRSMEAQFTEYESAAYAVFVVLLSRIIATYELNLYIPISKLDENMLRARDVDAVVKRKFWFRVNEDNGSLGECKELTVDEIMNGEKNGDFAGLIPMMYVYLDTLNVDDDTRAGLVDYIELVRKRSTGELMTNAKWIRRFVTNHPDYKQDSVISETINYDLITKIMRITRGEEKVPELIGERRAKQK